MEVLRGNERRLAFKTQNLRSVHPLVSVVVLFELQPLSNGKGGTKCHVDVRSRDVLFF